MFLCDSPKICLFKVKSIDFFTFKLYNFSCTFLRVWFPAAIKFMMRESVMKRTRFTAAVVAFALAATSFTTGTGLVFAADDSDITYSLGDTSGDGLIDAKDASEILAEYSRLSTNVEGLFTGSRAEAADVDKNGRIDSSDASKVLKYYSYLSIGGTRGLAEYLADPNAEEGGTTTSTEETTAPDETTTTTAVSTGVTTDTETTASAPTTTTADPNGVTAILLSRSAAELKVGDEELAARLTIQPDSATDLSTDWSSSDESVVTVDENGMLKAVSAGTATITVRSLNNPDVAAQIAVTVTAETTAPADPKMVTAIHLDRTEMTIAAGTGELSARVTMLPATAVDLREIWTSSDESVAVVDGEGYVTAIYPGSCTITVQSANNPAVTATIEVTVTGETTTAPAATTAELTTTTVTETTSADTTSAETTTTAAESETTATTTETTTTAASETAEASTTSEETTSAETSTTASTQTTASDTTTTETSTTSTAPLDPDRVAAIKLSSDTLTLAVGEKGLPYVTIIPDTAKNKKEIWSSSDVSVATVDKFGNITAEGIGKCTVSVRSDDNPDAMAEIAVKVVSDTTVRAISLSDYSLEIEVGELGISWVTMLPDKATNKNEIWSCSDTEIAIVDQNGWIRGKSVGECTVTVTSADNTDVKADIKVTVIPKTAVSYIVKEKTTSEHTAFCTFFPKKAKGNFTIEYVIMNTNGTVNTIQTSPLSVPELPSYTAYLKGETDNFEVSTYVINNATGERAIMGIYRFYGGGQSFEIKAENIEYAFSLVKGLSE